MSIDPPYIDRRAFLAAGAAAVAGCSSLTNDGSGNGGNGGNGTDGGNGGNGSGGNGGNGGNGEVSNEPKVGNDFGELVENFDDASHWSPVGEESLTVDDGSMEGSPGPARGRNCLHVQGSGATQAQGEYRQSPLDLSGKNLSIALSPEAPSRTVSFYVYAFDPDGNYMLYQGQFPGYLGGDGWLRLDLRRGGSKGDVDLSYITEMRVRASADGECSYRVDDIRAVPRPDRGKVMLMFDEAFASHYDVGLKKLQEHELRGAFAVPTGVVNTGGRMRLSHLHEAEESGSELISYSNTTSEMTDETSEIQRRGMERAQSWLREQAQNDVGANHFVYPRYNVSHQLLQNAGELHDYAYTWGGRAAAAVTDPRTVARVDASGRDIGSLKGTVDDVANHRDLAIFTFRDFTGTTGGGDETETQPGSETNESETETGTESGTGTGGADNTTATETPSDDPADNTTGTETPSDDPADNTTGTETPTDDPMDDPDADDESDAGSDGLTDVERFDELLAYLNEADVDVIVPSEFAALQSELQG